MSSDQYTYARVCMYLPSYTYRTINNKKLKDRMVEEILGQHSAQAVAWLFIPIVIQTYNKSEQKD